VPKDKSLRGCSPVVVAANRPSTAGLSGSRQKRRHEQVVAALIEARLRRQAVIAGQEIGLAEPSSIASRFDNLQSTAIVMVPTSPRASRDHAPLRVEVLAKR
jgi:hypothetical protein